MHSKPYFIDTETNGFVDTLDTVFSLVIENPDGYTYSCCDDPDYVSPNGHDTSMDVKQGVEYLCDLPADAVIVAHNAIKFDIPALKKVYRWFATDARVRDTLLLSRLIFPELRDQDFKAIRRNPDFPKKLIGRHSLEAWGHRLRCYKGSYAGGFDAWSPSMQEYCEQDKTVLKALWELLLSKRYHDGAIELEHDFAEIIFLQEDFGFPFDEEAAVGLYTTLCHRRLELTKEIQSAFPPWWQAGAKTTPPRTLNFKDVMRPSLVAGAPYTKVKLTEFNPGSRDHISSRLIHKHGWKPVEFTPEGKPKVDEEVLSDLVWPEAKLLGEYLMVEKRIGQIAEGKQAWLKQVRTKPGRGPRIYGRMETVGAVTRRCTHKEPNVSQTPSIVNAKGPVPYGAECRRCFTTIPGYKLVGVDASGIELRALAHYMARYDDGAYAKEVVEGDVHTANQNSAGLPTRANAKTFIYAFLYGAGDAKIGSIIQKGPQAGRKLKTRFLERTPALKRVKKDVMTKAKAQGWLKGLDGGRIVVRRAYSSLNTLLQSFGAIIMKRALVLLYNDLSARGWVFGEHYAFVANVHDEIQAIVREDLVDEYEQVAIQSIRDAGVYYNVRCPLDGEAKHGSTWADTH